jgi:AsmA protein
VLEQKQRKLEIPGDVSLSLWPNVGIKLGKLSLSEANSNENFLAIDDARISVALMPLLSKQVSVNAVELNGLKATLIKRKDGTLNIADLMGPAAAPPKDTPTPPTPMQIDVSSIKLGNAQLTWRDEKAGTSSSLSDLDVSTGRVQADTGKQTYVADAVSIAAKGKSGADSFELKLEAPKITVTPDKAGGDSIKLSATLAGSGRNVAIKLGLSGVEGNAQALKIGKLALELDAKANDASVKGTLESPVAVNLTAQTVALEKLSGKLDIAHPQMPMKQVSLPLSGSLRADLAKSSANLNLGTQFDESKIAVKLDVAKFAPLALGFDLDIDQLNVDKYLPPAKEGEKPAAGADPKIDLAALKGLNLKGNIRIGALQVAKVKVAKLNVGLAANGGQLNVSPLSANLYEGSLNGSLSVNANSNSFVIKQALAGIQINPLMKDAISKDLLEGKGSVNLDLTTRGETVGALKKALAGTASLSLKDGALKGINLAQSFRDIKSKLGSKQDATQQAKAGDKTDFSELTGSFKIANGVAHNEDLAMKSPFVRLGGAGDIDIGNNQMNYVAKASVVSTTAGQGGKEADQLKGITVPVRVTGPFDNLSYKIEFGSLVSEAAKAKVEEKKAEVKQKVEEKAKDKLKGLFGR